MDLLAHASNNISFFPCNTFPLAVPPSMNARGIFRLGVYEFFVFCLLLDQHKGELLVLED